MKPVTPVAQIAIVISPDSTSSERFRLQKSVVLRSQVGLVAASEVCVMRKSVSAAQVVSEWRCRAPEHMVLVR
jgi:hypothetical protein